MEGWLEKLVHVMTKMLGDKNDGGTDKMRDIVEKVKILLAQTPPDWMAVEALSVADGFTKEEITYMALAVTEACFYEYRFLCFDHKEIEFEKMHSTYLLRSLKLLLKLGLDSNDIYASENILWNIKDVDLQDVGPSALRLLLEHGGNPNLQDPEGSSQNLLAGITDDVEYNYDNYVYEIDHMVKYMLVLIAFGAHWPDGETPLTIKEGYDPAIFKNFEEYNYRIVPLLQSTESCYGCWIMHIYEKKTGIEVATWE